MWGTQRTWADLSSTLPRTYSQGHLGRDGRLHVDVQGRSWARLSVQWELTSLSRQDGTGQTALSLVQAHVTLTI